MTEPPNAGMRPTARAVPPSSRSMPASRKWWNDRGAHGKRGRGPFFWRINASDMSRKSSSNPVLRLAQASRMCGSMSRQMPSKRSSGAAAAL
jgi:hypothetical protein